MINCPGTLWPWLACTNQPNKLTARNFDEIKIQLISLKLFLFSVVFHPVNGQILWTDSFRSKVLFRSNAFNTLQESLHLRNKPLPQNQTFAFEINGRLKNNDSNTLEENLGLVNKLLPQKQMFASEKNCCFRNQCEPEKWFYPKNIIFW